MNERIEKLAKQANAHETGHAYYRGEKKPENAVTLHSVDLEKFAELLIQECIHAVEGTNDRYRREYFAGKIREHFGVE